MPANKDKNGTWTVQCYYTDWTGTRKKKKKRGFQTKRDALEWERDFLAKERADISMSLAAFSELYFADAEQHLRPSTLHNRRLSFTTHILPYFGNRSVSSITAADIRHWQNRLLQKGLSASYVQQVTARLSILFNFAVRYYGLSENPCRKAGSVKKTEKQEMLIWTPDEYRAFRETVKDRPELYISYQLLFYTGLRVGELLALTIADFDQAASTISITKTMLQLHGVETITPPKTPKGKRIVALPPFLVEELSEFIRRMYYYPNPEYHIIPIGRATIKKYIDRNCEKAGVKRIRVHDLRHSHASLLIHQGVSPVAIADRLGHEDATVTLSVYSHLYPTERNAIADGLEQFK